MSWASSEGVRRSMQSNRGKNTSVELAVRRLLHGRGLRYRVDARPLASLRTRADIIFTRSKTVIYIDGCFWHGCPIHATFPKTNSDYWLPKLKRNRERDLQTTIALEAAGWNVLRYWEHEAAEDVAQAIAAHLDHRKRQE